MATAGMGDVLAGVIGAAIGQFGFSRQSVEAAVVAHARAGDDAARDGERGLLASDLLPHLRRQVNPS
jgi:NAD(P)H-hydrate epimerase